MGQMNIWPIFKRFLLGCRQKVKNLACHGDQHWRAVDWALNQVECTCLDQLENIKITLRTTTGSAKDIRDVSFIILHL